MEVDELEEVQKVPGEPLIDVVDLNFWFAEQAEQIFVLAEQIEQAFGFAEKSVDFEAVVELDFQIAVVGLVYELVVLIELVLRLVELDSVG